MEAEKNVLRQFHFMCSDLYGNTCGAIHVGRLGDAIQKVANCRKANPEHELDRLPFSVEVLPTYDRELDRCNGYQKCLWRPGCGYIAINEGG